MCFRGYVLRYSTIDPETFQNRILAHTETSPVVWGVEKRLLITIPLFSRILSTIVFVSISYQMLRYVLRLLHALRGKKIPPATTLHY